MNLEPVFTWFIESGVHLTVYTLAVASLIYFLVYALSETFDMYIRDFKYRMMQVREQQDGSLFDNSIDDMDTFSDGAMKELAKKLHVVRKKDKNTGMLQKPKSIQNFMIETFAYGIGGMVIAFMSSRQVVLSVVFGLILATIPYMILVIKVNSRRKKISENFLAFVQTFTQQYNSNSNDVLAGLRGTLMNTKDPEMKVLITKLVTDINQTREERGVRRAVNEFVYASGSSWAKRLGSLIVTGYIEQFDISKQLQFLETQVVETEEMMEQESTKLKELTGMSYILPIILVASVYLSWYTTKIQGFWEIQFGRTVPLMLLLFSIVGVIFAVIIGRLLANIRNDI